MAPRTRRSTQVSASPPTTATPTTPATSLFAGSNKASKTVTPDTSDIDEDEDEDALPVVKGKITTRRQTRASVAKGPKKRVQESESDEPVATRAPKRRVVAKTAFVEVLPVSSKAKGKVCPLLCSVLVKVEADRSVADSEAQACRQRQGKGQRKGQSAIRPSVRGRGRGRNRPRLRNGTWTRIPRGCRGA